MDRLDQGIERVGERIPLTRRQTGAVAALAILALLSGGVMIGGGESGASVDWDGCMTADEVPDDATTVYVGFDTDASLQAAIDSADAGDAIVVEGVVQEQLVIDKPLTLYGSGSTVLDTAAEQRYDSRLGTSASVRIQDTERAHVCNMDFERSSRDDNQVIAVAVENSSLVAVEGGEMRSHRPLVAINSSGTFDPERAVSGNGALFVDSPDFEVEGDCEALRTSTAYTRFDTKNGHEEQLARDCVVYLETTDDGVVVTRMTETDDAVYASSGKETIKLPSEVGESVVVEVEDDDSVRVSHGGLVYGSVETTPTFSETEDVYWSGD